MSTTDQLRALPASGLLGTWRNGKKRIAATLVERHNTIPDAIRVITGKGQSVWISQADFVPNAIGEARADSTAPNQNQTI